MQQVRNFTWNKDVIKNEYVNIWISCVLIKWRNICSHVDCAAFSIFKVDKKCTLQFRVSLTVNIYCQNMTSVCAAHLNENNQQCCPFGTVEFYACSFGTAQKHMIWAHVIKTACFYSSQQHPHQDTHHTRSPNQDIFHHSQIRHGST